MPAQSRMYRGESEKHLDWLPAEFALFVSVKHSCASYPGCHT